MSDSYLHVLMCVLSSCFIWHNEALRSIIAFPLLEEKYQNVKRFHLLLVSKIEVVINLKYMYYVFLCSMYLFGMYLFIRYLCIK